MNDGGKGSGRRPKAISDQQYEQRWDLIFGKDNHETDSAREPVHQLEDAEAKPDGQ